MNTAETKKCKRGCTCHLNKGTNPFDAACDLVNEFLIAAKTVASNKNIKNGAVKKYIASLNDFESFFYNFANFHYETKDGKDDDIKVMANLALHIVKTHIKNRNIEFIDHVKPKHYPDGNIGWTACTNPK